MRPYSLSSSKPRVVYRVVYIKLPDPKPSSLVRTPWV